MLEFLASRVPKAYLRLAQLVVEIDRTRHGRARAKTYVRRYLEDDHILDRHDAWFVLADLCQEDRDVQGEVHALCEAAFLGSTPVLVGGVTVGVIGVTVGRSS